MTRLALRFTDKTYEEIRSRPRPSWRRTARRRSARDLFRDNQALLRTRLRTNMELRALVKGSRVLPFQLFPSLRVGRVRDEQGRDLQFVQEGKSRDADMMFDRKTGDKRFTEMMQDFTRTHYNKDVSTEEFKRAVEKHMTREMDLDENGRMDWFFNQWVYGTEVPSYRFEYAVNGDILTGRVTQSGVSENFAMLVPVYVDLGKGWVRLGAATIRGNSTTDLGQIRLPQAPKRVAVAPFKDVLALSIENKKQ